MTRVTDPPAPVVRAGFGRLLASEWTKLRSVPRWVLGFVASSLLTTLVGLLIASSSGTDANEASDFVVGPGGAAVVDDFQFVHQTLTGDGVITARVLSQRDSHEWAKAGVLVKENLASGSRYVAAMLTPRHGVRLQAEYGTDTGTAVPPGPRWLRLTRIGDMITAYQSADGGSWAQVGAVRLADLPPTVRVGVFVASPPTITVVREAGATGMGLTTTRGSATFDRVRVEPSGSSQPAGGTGWQHQDIGQPMAPGGLSQDGDVLTVTGSGDIAAHRAPDDPVEIALFGAVVGLMALTCVSVLSVTSEYRRGLVRTTLTATPRRSRVLAAKALVMGAVGLVTGLFGSVTAFLLAVPVLRSKGFGPPVFPPVSLLDWPVLRAVVGTGVLLAMLAVFGVGVGVIVRHGAGAIATVVGLVIVPILVAAALPARAAELLMRLTPAGGLAIERAQPPTDAIVEPWAMVGPWAGLGVVAAYTAAALAAASWVLRRRDV